MSKFVITATWEDVPHLSEETKAELLAGIPPYQRDARTKGIPQLGSGAIYPVPEQDILINDFPIPSWYPQGFAMDVGWNRTAALWGALDREKDILYLTHEHYRGQAEPIVHSTAIKAPGGWIPGVIDPAARQRSQKDGVRLMQTYIDLGLNLHKALNAVESGIYLVWQRLSTGKLRVFRSLSNWLLEYRVYQRDVDGQIVKENDHLMDCMRYLVVSGIARMITQPFDEVANQRPPRVVSAWG